VVKATATQVVSCMRWTPFCGKSSYIYLKSVNSVLWINRPVMLCALQSAGVISRQCISCWQPGGTRYKAHGQLSGVCASDVHSLSGGTGTDTHRTLFGPVCLRSEVRVYAVFLKLAAVQFDAVKFTGT